MVNVVSAVSAAQNSTQNPSVQSGVHATPAPAPSQPPSSINFVTSEIYVDNLQNVAILEYRSSQTGQVLQQYPNQAQINAFKAAQQLAAQASQKQEAEAAAHQAATSSADTTHTTDHVSTTDQTTNHVSVPTATTDTSGGSSGSSVGAGSSDGTSTTSVVA